MPDPTPARPAEHRPEAPKAEPAAAKAAEPAKPVDPMASLAESIKALADRTPHPGGVSATEGLDVAPPGGRFILKGKPGAPDKLVNSANRELNDDGSLKYPEQQQLDPFGRLV